MKMLRIAACFLILAVAGVAAGAEQTVFGPKKYDVKDRYGKKNLYTAQVPAAPGFYVIQVLVGEKPEERPDYLWIAVNGRKVAIEDRYSYRYLAGFVELAKENTLELGVRDEMPAGFRRPPATPRNVTITVLPVPPALMILRGTFGLASWEALKDAAEGFQRIKNPAAVQLAMDSISVHHDTGSRAAAVRKLSDLRERTAEEFLLRLFNEPKTSSDVRSEACLALAVLGDKKFIPLLARTILDPDDGISMAAARGLSLYPEEDTQPEMTKVLEKLDPMRKNSAVKTIVNAGWKPVNTIIGLANSSDLYVANMAVGILGGMKEARATDHLLKMLENPGKTDMRIIIRALGDTGDPRVIDVLLAVAADPVKRQGKESDLADALVKFGDQRAAGPIAEMIKKASNPNTEWRLRNAYRRLTGKDY